MPRFFQFATTCGVTPSRLANSDIVEAVLIASSSALIPGIKHRVSGKVNRAFSHHSINYPFMSKIKPETISHKPLFAWFDEKPSNRRDFRLKTGYSDGRITNWKRRGIPRAEVGQIAAIMGLTYEQYMKAAGVSSKTSEKTHQTNAPSLDGGRRAGDNDAVLQFIIATYYYADPDGQEEIEETVNIVAGRKRKSAGGDSSAPRLPASESRSPRIPKAARLSPRRKRG